MTKSAFVSLLLFDIIWFYMFAHNCMSSCCPLQGDSSLPGRRKLPFTFPESQKLLQLQTPQEQLLIPGLQKEPDSLRLGDLSFQLLFPQPAAPPVCVSHFARTIFTQRDPWCLCFMRWAPEESHPMSASMRRVPGAPWS